MDEVGNVYLGEYGLLGLIESDEDRLLSYNSPEYLSPEIILG